jgi:tetratricopeptide (TPR) repeat protein
MLMTEQLDVAIAEAWKAHRAGDHEAAIEKFREVLLKDSRHVDALYGLGLAQKSAGDKSGAKKTFDELTRLLEDILANGAETEQSRYRMELRMVKQQLEMLDT